MSRSNHPRAAIHLTLVALLMVGVGAYVAAQQTAAPAPDAEADPVARPSTTTVKVIDADDPAPAGRRVSVTLSGGSKVTADLLRENSEGIVLDLGFDVMHVPAGKVLDIQRGDAAEQGVNRTKEHDIYQTGRLEARPVPELVRRFGDSVVMVKTPLGLGSGFFISDRGHLITNYHVVENESKISVVMFKRTKQGYERRELKNVRILALHPLRDIALLQLAPEAMEDFEPEALTIARNSDLNVGALVFAIGNPLGMERSVTQGIVSSTTRTLGHLRFIQTDAAINPGNSGGPLFNERGEIVGIVCAGATYFEGLAFGIPADDLVDFLDHREAYLYDPTQPNSGVRYLEPPYRPAGEEAADKKDA